MLRRSCLLIALVVMSIGAAARAESPATRLPGDTLAYLHWAGRSLTFDGSMCGQMLNDPNAARMMTFVQDLLLTEASDVKTQEIIRRTWELATMAWQRPVTVALLRMGESEVGELQLAMLIDLGKDREAFARKLGGLLKAAESPDGDAAEAKATYEQVQLGTPDSPLELGYLGETFYLALGKGTPEIIGQLDQADTLAGTTAHAEALGHVGGPVGEPLQLVYYVDVQTLKKQINALAGIPEADMATDANAIQTLGINEISAVAGSWQIVEKGILSRAWIKTPAPHEGLLSFFDGASLTEADLQTIPGDADVAVVVNADPKRIWEQIQRMATVGGAEAAADFAANRMAMEKTFNLSLDEDVLAALGDTWTLSMADSQGGPLTGIMLSVEVRDEAKFNAALDQILPKIEQVAMFTYAMQIGRRLRGREVAPEDLPSPIQSLQVGEATIQYVRILTNNDLASAILPAWCVHNKRLYVALWPQTIASALQAGVKPITANPDYQRLRSKLHPNANWMIWVDNPKLLRKVYPLAVIMGTLATNETLKKTGTLQVPPLWPSGLTEMTQYLWPGISTLHTDETGIMLESYSSHPMLISTTGSSLAAMTSVLLPSLNRARRNAMKSVSMANLSGMGTASMMYSVEWEKLPPDFEALSPYLTGAPDESAPLLVSPLSGRPAPRYDEKTERYLGETDYILIDYTGREDGGKPESIEGVSQTLLAYERTDNYGPGEMIPVLMVDGHVEQVTRERLAELIKEARDKGGKLPAWAKPAHNAGEPAEPSAEDGS